MKANISISLDIDLLQIVNERARSLNATPSTICQRALRQWVKVNDRTGKVKGDKNANKN